MLANDIQRCMGYESETEPCINRDRCLRYIERNTGSEWTPFGYTCDNYQSLIVATPD